MAKKKKDLLTEPIDDSVYVAPIEGVTLERFDFDYSKMEDPTTAEPEEPTYDDAQPIEDLKTVDDDFYRKLKQQADVLVDDNNDSPENCSFDKREIEDENDPDYDDRLVRRYKKDEENPFNDVKCDQCVFFRQSKVSGNRFGQCFVQERTVFAKYGCRRFFDINDKRQANLANNKGK